MFFDQAQHFSTYFFIHSASDAPKKENYLLSQKPFRMVNFNKDRSHLCGGFWLRTTFALQCNKKKKCDEKFALDIYLEARARNLYT